MVPTSPCERFLTVHAAMQLKFKIPQLLQHLGGKE